MRCSRAASGCGPSSRSRARRSSGCRRRRRSAPPRRSSASTPTASSTTTCRAWTTTTSAAGSRRCTSKWDEATAVLAGDALQTLAFEILAAPQGGIDPRHAGAADPAAGAGGGRGWAWSAGRRSTSPPRRRAAPLDLAADRRPAGAEDRRALRLGGGVRARSSGGQDPEPLAALRRGARARLPDRRRHPRRRGRSPRRRASGCGKDEAAARRPSSRCSASTARGRGPGRWSPRPATALAPYGSAAANLRLAAQFVLADA